MIQFIPIYDKLCNLISFRQILIYMHFKIKLSYTNIQDDLIILLHHLINLVIGCMIFVCY